MKTIPNRWLEYTPVGAPIQGTRFIAFKVPLRTQVNDTVPDVDTRLDPGLLLEKIPNLGLIIDLTNTYRYYDSNFFKDNGVYYIKLMMEGHGKVPPKKQMLMFNNCVQDFLSDTENNEKLVGVHCTHGINRTGYVICQYMTNVMKIPPLEAISLFEEARGHAIERHQYLDAIKGVPSSETDEIRNKYNKRRRNDSTDDNKSKRNHYRELEPPKNVFKQSTRHAFARQPYNVDEEPYQSRGSANQYSRSNNNYHTRQDGPSRTKPITNWRTDKPTEPLTRNWRNAHNNGPTEPLNRNWRNDHNSSRNRGSHRPATHTRFE